LCFLLNAYWEARDSGFIGKKKTVAAPAKAAPAPKAAAQTPAATPAAKANP